MFSAAKRYGLWLIAGGLIFLPISIFGQDLGSSSGLFRASNPASKKTTTAEKKPSTKTAVKRAEPKPTVAKSTTRNNVKKPSSRLKTTVAKEPGKTKTTPKQQPAARAALYSPSQKDVVIKVGNPTDAKSEEIFESAIDQGNSARDARNYSGAERAYRQALAIKPKDSRAIYGLGNIFSDQQRWEEAEKAYRQAIVLEPDSPEAHIALSFVLTQPVVNGNLSDRYTEAEQSVRRAIQLDSKSPVAFDQLGVALEMRGNVGKETQDAYRKAIQFDPNFALAYAHLGRLLRRLGKNEESALAYKDAIRLSTDVPTMILVAEVMQSQQRYEESEQLLRRALKADPKNPTALFFLGKALTIRGNFEEAERLLKASVQVSPTSFVSYALLSSLYSRRGFYDLAEQTLIQAVKIVSPNEKKRLAVEFEIVGDGLMRLGRNADAARLYRQAISLDKEKNDLTVKLDKAVKS